MGKGTQLLVWRPNVVHGTVGSGLWGSPQAEKCGSRGTVTVLSPLPTTIIPSSTEWVGAQPRSSPAYGQIGVRPCPVSSMQLVGGQAVPLSPSEAGAHPLPSIWPGWGWALVWGQAGPCPRPPGYLPMPGWGQATSSPPHGA